MNGFLNIAKPVGLPSAAVVGKIRRMTGEKRVGHAGTLDPEAAGVLPVMTGKATRLFDYLVDKEKEYTAVVSFGRSTDTQDATGQTLETGTNYPDRETVMRHTKALTGDILQRPSVYSAIKVGGKPLYAYARSGETREVPERLVHVDTIDVGNEQPDHGFEIHVRCGKGTYIRSICDDLGKLCGCPAHMRSLIRTRSGVFTLEDAISPEQAAELAEAGRLGEKLMALDTPLGHLERVDIPEMFIRQVRNGVRIPAEKLVLPEAEGIPFRVYCGHKFRGIARRQDHLLYWAVLFAEEDT